MNMLLKPQVTVEMFEDMPGMDGFELIDGVPQEKSMGFEASYVQRRLSTLLGNFVDNAALGWVAESEGGYACFPERKVRKPDVSFVRRGRFPEEQPPKGYARIAPDLAVEVVSPTDLCEELEAKLQDYRAVGVPVIWVVYPTTRTMYVCQAGRIEWLTADDDLLGDPVLPGFRVRVAELFPPPAESPTS